MERNMPKIIKIPPVLKTNTYPPKGINNVNKTESNDKFTLKNIVKDLPQRSSDDIFIIGGGPSLSGFDFKILEGYETIVVNKAIEYVENPTYFITMDYSFFKKTTYNINDIIKKSKYSYFVLNASPYYIKEINGEVTDIRNNIKYTEIKRFTGVIKSSYEYTANGFGNNINAFSHGSNSGYCAIQLAILLGYKNIYLLGFDMNTGSSTHFHNGYKQNESNFKKNLGKYKENLINSIKKTNNINIYSCSDKSALNSYIKYIDINTILNKYNMNNNYVKGLDNLVIVAYYTTGTPYEQEARKLSASLDKLNLKYDIVGVPNLGSWQANTRFKAQFMLDMLDKHIGKNLLYVDSDAVVHSKPILFEDYSCDIAVRWQDFRWRENECLSGTIFMANNEKTRKLCNLWLNVNNSEGPNATTFEQWNLGKVIKEMNKSDGLIDKNLPAEYTFIFDSMRRLYPNAKPVIEHFQASRRLKNTVKK